MSVTEERTVKLLSAERVLFNYEKFPSYTPYCIADRIANIESDPKKIESLTIDLKELLEDAGFKPLDLVVESMLREAKRNRERQQEESGK